jgi:hypothetical protein
MPEFAPRFITFLWKVKQVARFKHPTTIDLII